MKFFRLFITVLALIFVHSVSSQTTVNSLVELKPYLDDDNANVKLAPGTYWITVDDLNNGLYVTETDILDRLSNSLLLFEGNNSTYDFTGVTINIETGVFRAYGNNHQIYEVHTIGNNNVIKNLTLVDVGSVDDSPAKGANSIVMDGSGNRVEGFHCTIKGSFPYGYGDAFGKGGGPVIPHKKHSACLIRGESNHVKNCTFIHRSYGHCIYMQAASNPKIEGCYVEGEVRTTDDMLAEEGTGSPADNVDFMTTWGYRLPSGYMMSLAEAGIRAYNAGETIINGVEYSRGTSNPTVLNCTVKYMRTGVTVAHATGTKYVDGCTAIGCENGFSLGSGTLTNCKADCTYGPVYQNTYQSDRGYFAEIEVISAIDPYYNGSNTVAYVGGSNHNITLTGADANINKNYAIKFGGEKEVVRLLGTNSPNQNNFTVLNCDFTNDTNYPINIISGSSGNTINSCAPVVDNGNNNTVVQLNDCAENECYIYPDSESPAGLVSGLKYYYYEGNWTELPNFNTEVPEVIGTSNGLDLSEATANDNYGFRFYGYVNIPEDGEYTFYTTSNDGSKLLIDGDLVVNNTGSGASEVTGNTCLEAGLHEFRLDFYEAIGNENLSVKYESTSISKQDVSEFYYVSTPENLALNGVATQSTTDYGGVPERAIDGNSNGLWNGDSVTHTEHGDDGSGTLKWWQLDLQSNKVISKINIYGRTDGCCSDRLNNFTVSVIDSNGVTTFSQFYADYPNPLKAISLDNVTGQIIRIEKTSDSALSLAEVQILGVNSSALSVNEFNLSKINAYPNPVNDFLNISLVNTNLNGANLSMVLYSIHGQKVMQTISKNTKEARFDLSELNEGLYILMISDNINTISKKIIKL